MKPEGIPVSCAILKWGRETLGMSCEYAAGLLNDPEVSGATIELWENGTQRPTYDQLEELAYKVYKRPLALFFFPEPPKEATLSELFPAAPPATVEQLSPDARLAIRGGVVYYLGMKELFPGGRLGTNKIWENISPVSADPTRTAQTILSELGEIPETPKNFVMLKNLFEKSGVAIFEHDLSPTELNSFNLFNDDFSLIVVNNRLLPDAKAYSLFYGLVNILSRQGSFLLNSPRALGADANDFSMPARREIAAALHHEFGAVLDTIDPTYTADEFYVQQIANLSPAYLAQALERYYENSIDKLACADYLNIMPRELENFLDAYNC